jgi:hypothetical protein
LPVYRASVPRTFSLVVALSSTVATTGVFAREFRAADTQREDYPAVQAARHTGRDRANVAPIGTLFPFTAGIHATTTRDPATAELIDRIRKVE